MTYEEATKVYNEAFAKFEPVRFSYTDRALAIADRPTDSEYFAALAEFKKAEKIFDEAFAVAQGA
jgi:hypothetical protein